MTAVLVELDERQVAELERRAKLHDLEPAEYLMLAALSDPTNPRGIGRDADDWWENLAPGRRHGVWAWLTKKPGKPPVDAPTQEEALFALPRQVSAGQ